LGHLPFFIVKVTVFVTPKKNVLDPQGAAVGHAMGSLGFSGLKNVRIGKVIEIDIDGEDTPDFRKSLDSICHGLLSNPVIEDYRYELS
jgi:phosphoribosylformylglycinamidine synthase subunit PurS